MKKTTAKKATGKKAVRKLMYTLTLRGSEVEIFRREYKSKSELENCLDCARKWDHVGGNGVYGFLIGRSGVHLEVADAKGKIVFNKDIKEEDLASEDGELQIELKGSYFDESAEGTKGKKYYYDCINWYRYVYKAELKLTAPFDPRKLSLICRPYIGPRGLERKFIQFSTFPDDKGMVYDGTSVTWVDQTPGGDDEMHVWTLVKGVRKELRVYSGGEDARW